MGLTEHYPKLSGLFGALTLALALSWVPTIEHGHAGATLRALTRGIRSGVRELRLLGQTGSGPQCERLLQPTREGCRALLSGLPASGRLKLLLTSDLFDVDDGGPLPELLADMLDDVAPGQNRTAVWLRDGRAGMPDSFVHDFWLSTDLRGMLRMRELGITRHTGLWINRHHERGAPMTLEDDLASNESREADLESVKALIDSAAVLYVPGGQAFRLMRNLRSRPGSAVWAHALGRLLEGRLIFMSRSAGTIIAGSNVEITGQYSSARNIDATKEFLGDPINWNGLGLLRDVAIRPHYTPGGMMGAGRRHGGNRENWSHDDFIENLKTQQPAVLSLPVDDGDFIWAYDGEVNYGSAY